MCNDAYSIIHPPKYALTHPHACTYICNQHDSCPVLYPTLHAGKSTDPNTHTHTHIPEAPSFAAAMHSCVL